MNNKLIVEQLELHFGDNYAEVTTKVRRFCLTIIKKPWFGHNLPILFNNEGGMIGMRQAAMFTIAEVGDIGEGLKTYGRYLRREYGSDKLHTLSLDEGIERLISHFRIDELEESGFPSEPVSESQQRHTHSQYVGLDAQDVLKSGEERQFFSYYSSVKSIREVCALMSMPVDDGMRLYDRVMHRAARVNLEA